MIISRAILIVLATTCLSSTLTARMMSFPSYQQLLDMSDLVVIATPTTKTADTKERSFFNVFIVETNGARTRLPAIGVETKFKIAAVLKGKPLTGEIVLHHLREVSYPLTLDGPLVSLFDPTDIHHRNSYLFFLVREPDGRYAPANGQNDGGSIYTLPYRYR